MTDQKNTILAIVLSALVLIGWQIFFGMPQMEKQKQIQQQQAQERSQQPPGAPAQQPGPRRRPARPPQAAPGATPQAPGLPGTAPGQIMTREAALAASPRVRIETPSVAGSIALKGARIDDLALIKYRETVDPKSPADRAAGAVGQPASVLCRVRLGARRRAPQRRLPTADTLWRQEGSGALTVEHPVTLVYDNGEGLEFRRTIAVDDKYLFTIKDEVVNKGAAPVTLYPYALISRHGTPPTLGYYILHEGLIGVFGDKGLQEETYAEDRGEEVGDLHVDQRAGSASPTNIGPRRCCPTSQPRFVRASPSSSPATSRPTRPTTCSTRRRSRPAPPARPTRGCSPAPRRSRSSTATITSSSSTASTC